MVSRKSQSLLFRYWPIQVLVIFQLYTADSNTPCGEITHEWPGYECELIQDGDSFGVKFPRDLDVTVKAAMIGACFLIVSWEIFIKQLRRPQLIGPSDAYMRKQTIPSLVPINACRLDGAKALPEPKMEYC